MNDHFLRHVLDEVLEYEGRAEQVLVFPNARSLSHFRVLLASGKRNSILPEMLSISEFLDQKSGLRTASKFEQRSCLDHLLSQSNLPLSTRQRDFLLADWNAIHVSRADEALIWRSSLETYKLAQLDSGDSTIIDRIRVLESVDSLRTSFERMLTEQALGTQSIRLNAAREGILSLAAEQIFHVVGFSKFSPLEWLFFQDLAQGAEVVFHSDMHEAYMSVKGHEASRVFKDIPAKAFRNEPSMVRSIKSLSSPGLHHQAKLVQAIVEESLLKKKSIGIVLMNEDFIWTLLPMLAQFEADINCSVKLSLGRTEAYANLKELLSVAKSRPSQSEIEEKLNGQDDGVKSSRLETLARDLILREWIVFQSLSTGMEVESAFGELFLTEVRSKGIVVKGDQDASVQIMGLLETRALNFDELILCNMNEGEIQGKKTYNSLIPFELKSAFSLPSQSDHDSLMAYHLYRLFIGARGISVLYLENGMDIMTGEQSRILKQLEYQHGVQNQKMISEVPSAVNRDAIDWKPQDWKERVWAFLEKGLSASALSSMLRDPEEFTRSYLLGIRRPSSLDDFEMFSQLGIYTHDVLEKLYAPFVGEELSSAAFDQMKVDHQMEISLTARIEEVLSRRPFLFRLVKDSVHDVIQQDRSFVKSGNSLKIIALEEFLSCELQLHGRSIKLKGFIDRIELRNSRLTVVDYKTGKVEQSDLNYREIEAVFASSKPKDKVHQLFIYAILLKKSSSWGEDLPDLCIQSLLSKKAQRFELHFASSEVYKSDLQSYEALLLHWIESELLNRSFDQKTSVFRLEQK